MVVTDSRNVPKLGYSSLCWVPPYTCSPMMANTIMKSMIKLAMAKKDVADASSTWVILRKLCNRQQDGELICRSSEAHMCKVMQQ